MATMPTFPEWPRKLIGPVEWNAHANQINTNTTDVATLTTRTTDATTGNTALGNRISTVETRTADASTGNAALGNRVTSLENRRKCILRKSAAQPIGTAADTIVTWDVVDENTGGMRSGNNIVVPAGNYWLAAQIRFPGNASGTERDAYIINYNSGNLTAIDTKVLTGLAQTPMSTGAGNILTFGRAFTFTTTTTLCVVAFQNSGVALDVSSTAFGGSTFSVTSLP
ncbi:hypothetical protein [Saccharopolyspora sp. NPDC002376]